MKSTTWLVVSAFLFGLLIGQPAISNASGVQSTGFTFCVNKSSGALRQLLKGSCNSRTENVLVMGAQGPAGPAGAQGPAGPAGAQGPAGNDGLDGENGIGVGIEWVDQSGEKISVIHQSLISFFPSPAFELQILLNLNGKTRIYSHFTSLPSYTTNFVWYSDSNCQTPAFVLVNEQQEYTFEEHRTNLITNLLPVFRTAGTFRYVTGLSTLPLDLTDTPDYYFLGWNSQEDDLVCGVPLTWQQLQNNQNRAYAITSSEIMPVIDFPITYRKVD